MLGVNVGGHQGAFLEEGFLRCLWGCRLMQNNVIKGKSLHSSACIIEKTSFRVHYFSMQGQPLHCCSDKNWDVWGCLPSKHKPVDICFLVSDNGKWWCCALRCLFDGLSKRLALWVRQHFVLPMLSLRRWVNQKVVRWCHYCHNMEQQHGHHWGWF